MLFAIIFLIAFIVIAAFAFYLSRTIEHGEARFDTSSPDAGADRARGDGSGSDDAAGNGGEHDMPV
ncbi:hypothetical protein CHX26_14755 [Porphyrobacter sp. HT-58-2]|uniref:hypothetical protein n=1 Tax=Porphyrobacter sp. HT-58-2 TaxID=2023229 RepID=UPI000CDC8F27|nr:hypothetical protein [Porphyrobacter sp. HT-58-2]AUX70589.1 hypothetical protein CHX26_14755 [Porphyrobacter sp. HT-58-2]